MTSIAVSLKNVSKKFRLFRSPRDRLLEVMHPFGKKYHQEFWALKDITLDIPQGRTLGIIGRNGSGKSTLLQIICSVLKPTSGSVEVNGRVSALLELGAGFNPEFTGRENVFLQGTLMGFSREEMEERFHTIEAFADIGEFINQPVKTYSSGMFVRLAFAAAISVDPDILVIDEAIAVGDAKYQHKCYTKLNDFRLGQKTILFVSHDTQLINAICNEVVLLEKGVMLERGKPRYVTKLYHKILFDEQVIEVMNNESGYGSDTEKPDELVLSRPAELKYSKAEIERLKEIVLKKIDNIDAYRDIKCIQCGNRKAEIIDVEVLDMKRNKIVDLELNEDYCFVCRYLFYESVNDIRVGLHIEDRKGVVVYGVNSYHKRMKIPEQSRGSVLEASFQMKMRLSPGDYFVTFGITSNDENVVYDRRFDLLHFRVISRGLNYKPESLVDLGAIIHISNMPIRIEGV